MPQAHRNGRLEIRLNDDGCQAIANIYPPSGKDGDRSGTLNAQWPRTAPCGQNYRSSTRGGTKVGSAKYIVVWVRSK